MAPIQAPPAFLAYSQQEIALEDMGQQAGVLQVGAPAQAVAPATLPCCTGPDPQSSPLPLLCSAVPCKGTGLWNMFPGLPCPWFCLLVGLLALILANVNITPCFPFPFNLIVYKIKFFSLFLWFWLEGNWTLEGLTSLLAVGGRQHLQCPLEHLA